MLWTGWVFADEHASDDKTSQLPILDAELAFAPHVPPPITRRHPVRLRVDMTTEPKVMPLDLLNDFEFWPFSGRVPGPFIRAREGDILDVELLNKDASGMQHNIDFHAVVGPGGGAPVLTADFNQRVSASFRLTTPGIFIYHCAVDPVGYHISNGMYGLMLVEPKNGLPKVDKEYYVMQGDIYTEKPVAGEKVLEASEARGVLEDPTHVVFNGRVGSLTDEPLTSNAGDRVRIFFGNAGPNLISSFHIIGAIMDKASARCTVLKG
jgi:copper-containing nitrite reductase